MTDPRHRKPSDATDCPKCETSLYVDRHKGDSDWHCQKCGETWDSGAKR